MKKYFSKVFLIMSVVMAAVVCFAFSTVALETEEFVEGDYVYVLEDSKAKITDYRGYDGDFYIYIPESIGGYEVSSIEKEAFYDLSYVTGIVFPDSVEYISEGAITYCPSLKYVSLGKHISYINGAFVVNCKKLGRIYVDEENNNFLSEDGVLYNKSKTEIIKYPSAKDSTEFIIPDGIVRIGEASFENCENLASVLIPVGVTFIDDYAFNNCKELNNVNIPNSVITIGNYAFKDCINFTSVIIPDNVVSIGDFAFACSETNSEMGESSELENVKLSKNITSISQGLFSGCTYLKEIKIPEAVVEICAYAFEDCFNLRTVEFSSALTGIGDYAFADCRSLSDVSFPEGLISIGQKVLDKSGYFNNNSNWKNNCLYVDCYLVQADVYAEPGIYEIDSKTKIIAEQTFKGCDITYLNIPEGIETIGYRTFAFSIIERIEIPESVEKIGYQAFYDCGWITDTDYNLYYNASQKEWNNIEVAAGNEDLSYARIHFKEMEQGESHSHQYTLIKNENADCTKSGIKTYICPCGDSYTETIKAIGHTNKTTTTKSTLTKNGKTVTKCSVCGDVSKTTIIYSPKTITLSTTSYTYDGKTKTPAVTVKDSKGNTLKKDVDYKVTYESGRKNPGKYSVRIDFIGNYEGTKRLYFTIAPKATSNVSAVQSTKAIELTWNKVTGADGYRVYQYNSKTKKWDNIKTTSATSYKVEKLSAGTAYKFRIKAYKKDDGTIWGKETPTFATATKCATPSITKLTTSGGKVNFTWSDVSGESGYQVYYSTKKDKDFKKVTSYKANVLKGSKSKLTKGKTYYFKVRAYKKTDSGTVFSAWSPVKSIKVK